VIIAGVILAAGASRRMGFPKAMLTWDNDVFIDRIIAVFDLPIDPLVVVVRAEGDIPALKTRQAGRSPEYVINPDAERGQLSSLQCGLAAVPAANALAFCPLDFPLIRRDTLKVLVREFESSGAPVVMPSFESRHGHPVLIRRDIADELLAEPPTSSAREVLHRHASETRFVAVDDPGVVADIDTPEEYNALRQKFEGR
jgi:molybdenum cofactor cytidylyltransferase